MEVDALALREGVAVVVVGDLEAEPLVMRYGTWQVSDGKDRLNCKNAGHVKPLRRARASRPASAASPCGAGRSADRGRNHMFDCADYEGEPAGSDSWRGLYDFDLANLLTPGSET